MAESKKAATDVAELSVEEKLRTLYKLQKINSEIDKIRTLRGELPLEVQDLEDEIAGLQTRIEKLQEEVKSLETAAASKKQKSLQPKTTSRNTKSSRITFVTTGNSTHCQRK
jgi:predicted  nucleic acid-binding Zn-ribbon protein